MLGDVKSVWEFVKELSPVQRAKFAAFFLAPALILGVSISRLGSGLSIDSERAVAISELKTEVAGTGGPSAKRGVVLIAEPEAKDFRIQLKNSSKIWSSLDDETVRSNSDRLAFNGDELKVITPFLGVSEPVAIVIDGDLSKDILVPGGTEPAENWRLSSRRSSSLVPGVLAVCFLALGMAVPTAAPPSDRDKNSASQVGTEPDKD
jgi:hypothetical protein